MNNKKLSYKSFLKTFELIPRVAISLLIEDKQQNFILTKRANEPFKNYWHLPGSFILKGEKLEECIIRIMKNEVGINLKNKQFEQVLINEDLCNDPRGHVIDIICRINLDNQPKLKPIGDTKEIKFFDKLPRKIGFNHKEALAKLGYK